MTRFVLSGLAGICVLVPAAVLGGPARPKASQSSPPSYGKQPVAQKWGERPLLFEANRGQTDRRVRFLARAAGMTAFLADREMVMLLSRRKRRPDSRQATEIEQTVVRMKLDGARTPRAVEGLEGVESISNYFIGSRPSKWVTNIRNYRKVRVSNVYPGIDLVYYGDSRKIEYDFVVRPGGDPRSVHLAYEGAERLTIDGEGNLAIATPLGNLIQEKPVVYQEINGERRKLQASYSIQGGRVEFALANWDRDRDLVIDPTLVYSTYFGGGGNDQGYGIAVDNSGAAYITGSTSSANFPTQAAYQTKTAGDTDIFVAKLNPAGSGLIYSTYIGGSQHDQANGIAIDAGGNAYITGYTMSSDCPTTADAIQRTFGGTQDAFVMKVSSSGDRLVYSTYLGGIGTTSGQSIAIDTELSAYITGYTTSTFFPTTPDALQIVRDLGNDAFVTKLSSSGNRLTYSTLLGGRGDDIGYSVVVDATGSAYVTGATSSPNFPTTLGAFQRDLRGPVNAFVTKLNGSGNLLAYSTFLGGSGTDYGLGIAIDSASSAYVAGRASSVDFPTTPGALQARNGGGTDAFVTKFDFDGGNLTYSTYLGGSGDDAANGISVAGGMAYVAGFTSSADLPASGACAFQTNLGGGQDAFAAILDANGATLAYSSYLGGSLDDFGSGIATDPSTAAYVIGYTTSRDFPTSGGAFQGTYAGGSYDAFVTKLNRPLTGAAGAIAVTGGSPQSAPVHTSFDSPLAVSVTDSAGNPLGGVVVTFAAPGAGASATLSAATATTDCGGAASILAVANQHAGSYQITATVAGVSTPATFSLTNLAGAVQTIAFIQQPSDAAAGNPISPPVTVKVTDADNNAAGNISVAMSLQEAGTPLLGTLTRNTNVSGVATFDDLNIHKTGTYHLQAAGGGLTVTSRPLDIGAASAVSIKAIGGGDQSAVVGSTYASPLIASVDDAFGNPVSGALVSFVAPAGGASITFAGPATIATDANGIAKSPAMTANGTPGSFLINASTAGATLSATFNLTNVAGAANKLGFVQQPTDAAAGVVLSPPVTVQLEDSLGNAAHTPNIAITLQLEPLAVGRLRSLRSFPPQVTDSNGLATFATLTVDQAGQYQLLAESGGIISGTSNTFNVHAGPGSAIRATGGGLQTASILMAFAEPLEATVTDSLGNPSNGVTVSFTAPGTGASAALSAATAVTDASGHARVTATANGTAGSYTVTASAPGISGIAAYSLTNVAAAAAHITFVQQPSDAQAGIPISPPVLVRLSDASNNPVSGAAVRMSLSGGAALGGTATAATDSSGQASFDDLRVQTSGTYQLIASAGAVSATSNFFQVSAAHSSVLISVYEGNGQVAITGTPYGGPLKASVADLFGNPVPGVAVTFAAPLNGASVSFAGNPAVTTDAGGIAVSPQMNANTVAGTFAVTAVTANADPPASFTLTNAPPASNKLGFMQNPSDTQAGAVITPPVTVQLLDSSGIPVHQAGVEVTIEPNAPAQRAHVFASTTTQATDGNGVATFSSLSGMRSGTYILQANATDLASATSNPFQITAGVPALIVASAGTPQNALINSTFGEPLQATVTDAGGNPVAGVPVVFLAPSLGPTGSFDGQTSVSVNTDALGQASAPLTANNIAGTYTVSASSSAITGTALFTLTNLPAGAGSLAFVQQPSAVQVGHVISPAVTVQVRDSTGNAVQVAGVPIVVSLSQGTGQLSGTRAQLTDTGGVARFSNLSIDQLGTKRLRASSQQQAPTDSSSFQVTAGPPSSISVVSGSPQVALTSQQFSLPLRAKVKDSAGFSVAGASVTFSVPPSGPSGTFAGPATVTTDSDGIATAPPLTANDQPGSFVAAATTPGVNTPAQFSLTILPQQNTALVVTPAGLHFTSEIGQAAPDSQIVQITSTGQPVGWSATGSAAWLAAIPTNGNTPGQMAVSVNPAGLAAGTYSSNILVTDSKSSSVAAVLVTYTITGKPTLAITPPTLVFTTPSNTTVPATQRLQASSSSRPIPYTVTAHVSSPPGGGWLQVGADQGTTTGTVTVNANPSSLADGIYDGSILFAPNEPGINQVAVPVTLIVGCGQGGCLQAPSIAAVVNGASFQPGGAARAIMTIFGENLSDAVHVATTSPLPEQLGPTSVMVNRTPAPLYYVSPTQINFQMPSDLATDAVVVTVTNTAASNQRAQEASRSYGVGLKRVDPGLFLQNGRAAALNGDLTVHTPSTPIPADGYVILYLTGEGPVSPPIADGVAAPSSPLSLITAQVQVTIGGKAAQVTFQGSAPGFAGLGQLNVIVPQGLTPGDQPVFVTIDGLPSNAGLITVK